LLVAEFLRQRYLFILVVLAQAADTLTFLPAVARVGIGAERNILVRHLYMTLGPIGPVLLKSASIGIVLAALWWVQQRHPTRIKPVVALVVVAGLFGAWSNVAFGLV
jgi:hypothetical protein